MEQQSHNNDFDLALEVGEIKGLVRSICSRLDKQNGALEDVTLKVNRHEVLWGKIGLVVTVIGAFVSMTATVVIDWIKRQL